MEPVVAYLLHILLLPNEVMFYIHCTYKDTPFAMKK
jgi:hypothetical protein